MCLYCSYMENNKGIRIVFLKYKEWNVIVERCITGQYLKRTDLVWGKILLILMNLYGEQLSLFEKLEIRLRFHVSFFFTPLKIITQWFLFSSFVKLLQISCEELPFNHARLRTFHRIWYSRSSKVCFEEGEGKKGKEKNEGRN